VNRFSSHFMSWRAGALETPGIIRPLRIVEIGCAASQVSVLTEIQTGLARFVAGYTTTKTFVAQEIVKPRPPGCTPKPALGLRICGKEPWRGRKTVKHSAPARDVQQIKDCRGVGAGSFYSWMEVVGS
jgi:hypothetical protein